MTRTTNARIAGFTFLAYIAAGITSTFIFRRAAAGEGIAERLSTMAAHSADAGVLVILGFIQAFSALVLGVTLYALTRDEDRDLAVFGLVCRVGEGVIDGLSVATVPALFWLARIPGAVTPDATAAHILATYLLRNDVAIPATFFAVGSTAFTYLLLRGRMIPIPLAWLGLVASVILVIGLPIQFAGWLTGSVAMLIWLPMLAFEVPLGFWLMAKGVATPTAGRIPETA